MTLVSRSLPKTSFEMLYGNLTQSHNNASKAIMTRRRPFQSLALTGSLFSFLSTLGKSICIINLEMAVSVSCMNAVI